MTTERFLEMVDFKEFLKELDLNPEHRYAEELKKKEAYLIGDRQDGKTRYALAYILWESLYKEYNRIGMINPNYNAGLNCIHILKTMLEKLGLTLMLKYDRRTSIDLNNGSSIIMQRLNSEVFKGYSLNTVLFEETSCMPKDILDQSLELVFPSLKSINGKLIYTSFNG